jgi:demethylmenaquinone methyltransferase/2-methoxy-6-polyprenyl-1,4-benzoquinol methylase
MHNKVSGVTDFGFRAVPAQEKARLVRDVFDSVASRYDVMNDLLSGGAHRLWKSALLDWLNPQPGERLYDVAGGTGDLARGFLERVASRPNALQRAAACAIICDINLEMLRAGVGSQAASPRDRGPLLRLCANAERLPFPNKSADAYAIAFGLRNVTHRNAALREAFRVLKSGGRFACLEFSHPITESLQKIYDAYSFSVIPWLGETVVGDRASYEYLIESIRRFPTQDALASMMRKAGFSRVAYANMTGGVVALHTAWRL